MARRRSYSWFPDYSQPTVSEIQSRAKNVSKNAKKGGQELHPIVVTGRQIAREWWGVAWCENLERYADYDSRIGRGKRYIRAGAVIDLQIAEGVIIARVQGSRRTPYTVSVKIDPLSKDRAEAIIAQCSRQIKNLEALLSGNFPEELQGLFTGRDGLFPSPKEIHFDCSCPDWASMCKHVAATLYGVGVRLDDDPLLFFKLRGIDVNRFIDTAVANRVERMLDNARKPSQRIISDQDLTELFGIIEGEDLKAEEKSRDEVAAVPAVPAVPTAEGARKKPSESRKTRSTRNKKAEASAEKQNTQSSTEAHGNGVNKPNDEATGSNDEKVSTVASSAGKASTVKNKAVKRCPEFIIQSSTGKEITLEAILAKVGEADKAYVRVDHNKVYWVSGDESGAEDLW